MKVFKEVDIDITIMYSSTKLGRFFPLKCPTPLALRSGVVYQFKSLCDADWSYIGKTKRHLSTRVKEHLSGKSAVADHVTCCSACSAGYGLDCFDVLCTSSSDFDARIKEALLIKCANPSLNRQLATQGSSYFLKIF